VVPVVVVPVVVVLVGVVVVVVDVAGGSAPGAIWFQKTEMRTIWVPIALARKAHFALRAALLDSRSTGVELLLLIPRVSGACLLILTLWSVGRCCG
jgi:hypothetical protein